MQNLFMNKNKNLHNIMLYLSDSNHNKTIGISLEKIIETWS